MASSLRSPDPQFKNFLRFALPGESADPFTHWKEALEWLERDPSEQKPESRGFMRF